MPVEFSPDFLENYPLFKKFPIDEVSEDRIEITRQPPPIQVYCRYCKTERTGWGHLLPSRLEQFVEDVPVFIQDGEVAFLSYTCNYCHKSMVYFLITYDHAQNAIRKVGQYPPLHIPIEKHVSRIIVEYEDLYRKGLSCEQHGYGIGAFGYYRRVVESIIDKLLDLIEISFDEEGRKQNATILEQARNSTVATNKIDLVKGLLPSSLRPNGINPLDMLYRNLSEGLHSQADEDCLAIAKEIRTSLVYLIDQLSSQTELSREYVSAVQALQLKSQKKDE